MSIVTRTPAKTTIFYQSSMGCIAQWSGQVVGMTATTIDIRFSKTKTFRYNLKNSGLLIVTKTKMKQEPRPTEWTSFDDNDVAKTIAKVGDNVAHFWNGKTWEA